MYEVIAKDNKVVATLPDGLVMSAYREGYLRKAKFTSGENGFKVMDDGMKLGPFNNGVNIILQPDYSLLPCGLDI